MNIRKKHPKKTLKKQYSFDPRFLKHNVMMATGALVICLFVASGIVERVVREMHTPFVAAVIAAVLVDLANDDRAMLGLPELTVNPVLVAAAQAKANDMAQKGYFSHTTPEGYDSWHWFKEVGYVYQYAGENLAVNFADSGDVQKAWMNSTSHRDNIVNAKYTEIGIATAVGEYEGKKVVFVVQMFGRPKIVVAEASGVEEAPPPQVVPPTVASASAADVLGSAVEVTAAPPEDESAVGALLEQDGDAAVFVSPSDIPWWAFLVAEPKQTLQYAYYIIGLLIIAALFFDVEWELHKHHIRHATKASLLLATMSMLFVVADWLFFAEPILAIARVFG